MPSQDSSFYSDGFALFREVGHPVEPYEQKTQQSPGLGFIKVWQFVHS